MSEANLDDHINNNHGLEEDEEQEIEKLMAQTFTNTDYMDDEIKNILIKQPPPLSKPQKTEGKSSKSSSAVVSEISDIQPYEQDHSMYNSQPQQKDQSIEQPEQHNQQKLTDLERIQAEQVEAYLPIDYEIVQKKYKMHLVNEDQKIKLNQNYQKGVPYYVNNHLKNNKITVAGVQMFYESNSRTFIIWSTLGQIIIYLPNTEKRIQFKPFQTGITALKISPNMQMIAVASNNMELAIYKLRQPIRIEDTLTYRLLPKPTLFYKIDHKNLQSNVIQVQFLQAQNDIQCIILNQYDEVFIIKIQKGLLKYKIINETLPITFTTVFMFKSFHMFLNGKKYVGLIISSNDAVTLAIIRPKFELIFVRQQTNRSSIIKQGRTPFIDYCNTKIMVVWDKFVDIINFQIKGSHDCPEYKVSTQCHYFFAENSLAVGFLSDTLIYQFSRSGIRIYSINRFRQGSYATNKQSIMKQADIYYQQLVLQRIPQVGSLVGQILTNSQPPLSQLRYLSLKIACTLTNSQQSLNHFLVYAYQNFSLECIQFLPYKQFVSRVIDSQGNWRLGMNTLKKVYEGTVFQLDNIRFNSSSVKNNKCLEQFKSICQDYIIRFVQKTKSIIQLNKGQNHWNTQDIQRQQSLFICDFLIRTDNSEFLMDEVITKMQPQMNSLSSLKAFILLKKLKTLGYQNISYYFNNLQDTFLSKLIYSLDIDKNQLSQIKSHAIRKKLYLQFVYLCTKQKDFYTPFVILMAKFKQDNNKDLILLLLYFLKKSISGQKLPIGTYSFDTHKQILKQIILKILTPQIYQQIFKVAPVPLFQEVLPCFFLPQTLPPLNSLQSDREIRDQLIKQHLQNDIIKSLIIENIPKRIAQQHCKGPYWMFLLKIFSRSLIVDTRIVDGLYYLTINQLINNSLVKQIISKKQTIKQLEQYRNLQDFIQRLSSLQYTELEILLLRLAKRYLDAIKLLLSQSTTRENIYELLEDMIALLTPQELQNLSIVIKNNIKFLAEKDITKLEWLLTSYYSDQQQVFLQVMKPYPELQLSLMSQFLKRKNSQNHELRVAYLQLLAKLGYKTKVQKQILTSLYPLDQSLEICRKYQILRGEAYIYQRTGNVTQAQKTHFKIINKQIQIIDQKDWSDEVMSRTLYQTLRETMRSCIKICKNITQREQYQSQINFMKIVEGFQSLKLKSTYHHFLICKVINQQIFIQLLQQIISLVSLNSILRYIEQNVKKLEFGTIRLLFSMLVRAYAYESQMLLRCQSMMQQNVDDIRDVIIQNYKQGFVTQGRCELCSIRQQIVIRFPCGHQIHPFCTTNNKICQVCNMQDDTYKLRQIIYKQDQKLQYIRLVKPLQPENIKKINRRQKLLEYEYQNNIIDEYTKNMLTRK